MVDTDYNDSDILFEAHFSFQIAEHFVCIYFGIEIFIRLMAFDRKLNAFADKWFVFDFILVAMTITETWLMTLVIYFTSETNDGNLKNASLLRLLRLLRLFRMARLVRLLRALPELMILVKGMALAARSVLLTLFLLTVIIYVFAIGFTQLSQKKVDYFRSVPKSMNTLLLHGCFGEDLPDVVYQAGDLHWGLGALMVAFVLLASLTVMNMLVGVLVEVVSVVAKIENETLQVQFVQTKLAETLSELDSNGDCQISRTEFESILVHPQAARALHEVGVDVVGLIDFTDFIFQGAEKITFKIFMDTVLQLRGSNAATVKDIVDLRKCVLQEMLRFETSIVRMLGKTLGGTMPKARRTISAGDDSIKDNLPATDLN
jgi:hypothetical protein